jgi:hypothetical protein
MSEIQPTANSTAQGEEYTALFAQLVLQQTNMAMLLLGARPHPESGETIQDLDGAKFFIDQLEMLEAKTKGNLTKEEAGLLKQSLMSLRLAFVEAVEHPAEKTAPPAKSPAPEKPAEAPAASGSSTDEDRKKFVKKY